MAEKAYNSLEYYAQEFRNFLTHPHGKCGGGFYAKHSGNSVYFRIAEINCWVNFQLENSNLYSVLDLEAVGKGERTFRVKLDIERSKAGRLSRNYYPRFFKEFVIKNLKEFSKEN